MSRLPCGCMFCILILVLIVLTALLIEGAMEVQHSLEAVA